MIKLQNQGHSIVPSITQKFNVIETETILYLVLWVKAAEQINILIRELLNCEVWNPVISVYLTVAAACVVESAFAVGWLSCALLCVSGNACVSMAHFLCPARSLPGIEQVQYVFL